MVEESMVAHVRGTPASGKTTLAHLFHKHYLGQDIHSIVIPVWPKPCNPDDPLHHIDVLVEVCHRRGFADINSETIHNADIVFILDEGQMSYWDAGLWPGFAKT